MRQAFIVDALRIAGGRRTDAIEGWHPADMGGEVLNALVDRSGGIPRVTIVEAV